MTVTLDSFLAFAIETSLESASDLRIEELIRQVATETNNFPGLCDEAKQDLAVHLYVAHILTIETRETASSKLGGGVPLTKIEGDNEKLEFAQAVTGRYDLGQTIEGARLVNLLYVNRNVAIWAKGC